MSSRRSSRKENIDPGKKLPPLGNKGVIPRIRLEKMRSLENSPRNCEDKFISLNINSSKSPSYRENPYRTSETLIESTSIQKNLFCNGCSISPAECSVF